MLCKKAARHVDWEELAASPQQCSGSFCPFHQRFFGQNNMAFVQQPPHSPNLALCSFWLFSKLKTMLKRTQKRTQLMSLITEKTTAELRSILEEEFIRCFQKWLKHWEKCVHLQGEYFEGD